MTPRMTSLLVLAGALGIAALWPEEAPRLSLSAAQDAEAALMRTAALAARRDQLTTEVAELSRRLAEDARFLPDGPVARVHAALLARATDAAARAGTTLLETRVDIGEADHLATVEIALESQLPALLDMVTDLETGMPRLRIEALDIATATKAVGAPLRVRLRAVGMRRPMAGAP